MTNKNIIPIQGSILVNKNVESVFDFFANPSNDHLWRKEINQSTPDGPLQIGTKIFEYSYLSRRAPNNLVELTCMRWEINNLAQFETSDTAPFHVTSKRQVRAISENTTEAIYTLEFDISIVKFALGFALPRFMVSLKAQSDMRNYLNELKSRLENA